MDGLRLFSIGLNIAAAAFAAFVGANCVAHGQVLFGLAEAAFFAVNVIVVAWIILSARAA